jgi:ATP-dependent DNA helicase RecQ
VLRQLIALGHVRSEGEYNTLELTATARDVLRGEVQLLLRRVQDAKSRTREGRTAKVARGRDKLPLPLSEQGLDRFEALKAWRAEVAREHNLPAYIVFHDATLAEMAQNAPTSLLELGQISGVGAKKLEAYGDEILRVLAL